MFVLSFLALSLFFISNARSHAEIVDRATTAVGPVSQLHIANKYIAPDGYKRSATLVNGMFPGPLIRGDKDDQFAIQVVNELTDDAMALETSVHWHGIFQHMSNWADGTSYVTQCPIRRKEQFVYKFNVGCQTGTYWYHSHYSTQYCDGLRGPLVIYDPDDPLVHLYDVDDENTVITLADWYHESSVNLGKIFGPVVANATLINGKGRYSGGPSSPLSVINVRKGLRYRFRVISLSCDPSFNFTIDGHRMTIIEVDGNEVEPVEVDSLRVFVGQRYSVVVAADKPVGNYWIRALSSVTNSSFSNHQNMAILRYEGAADEDPTSEAGPYEISFDEGKLHPLVDPGAPGVPEIGKADVNLVLAPGNNSEGYFTLNNVSYSQPTVPVLLQILSGARDASQLLPKGSVYTLPMNKVIEISFPDPTSAVGGPVEYRPFKSLVLTNSDRILQHPIHLHGHAFDVVRVAGSNVTNFVNPVRRDVVSIGNSSTDNVTIRFVTDNPGPWFLHCHIDWHLHHGFAAVMAEAPNATAAQESAVIPQEWYQLCEN